MNNDDRKKITMELYKANEAVMKLLPGPASYVEVPNGHPFLDFDANEGHLFLEAVAMLRKHLLVNTPTATFPGKTLSNLREHVRKLHGESLRITSAWRNFQEDPEFFHDYLTHSDINKALEACENKDQCIGYPTRYRR